MRNITLLVIPFALHFLHLLQIDERVLLLSGAQALQKVTDHLLVPGVSRGCQTRQVLQYQLLAVPWETQKTIAGDVNMQSGQVFCQRQVSEFTFQPGTFLANCHQAEGFGSLLIDGDFAQVGKVKSVVCLHNSRDLNVARLYQMVAKFGKVQHKGDCGVFKCRCD